MRRRHSRGRIALAQGLVLRRGVLGESDRSCSLYTLEYGKLPVRFIGVNRPHGKLKALSEPLVLGEYRLHLRDHAESALCVGGALATIHPRMRADLELLLRGLQVCELLDRLTPVAQPSPVKFALAVETLALLEATAFPLAGQADARGTGGKDVPLSPAPLAGQEEARGTGGRDVPLSPAPLAGQADARGTGGKDVPLSPAPLAGQEEARGTGGKDVPLSPARDWLLIAFALRLLGEAGFGVSQLPVSAGNQALWELLHDAPLEAVAALPADPARSARLESYLQRSIEGLTEKPLRTLRMRAQLQAPVLSSDETPAGRRAPFSRVPSPAPLSRAATGTRISAADLRAAVLPSPTLPRPGHPNAVGPGRPKAASDGCLGREGGKMERRP